MKCMTGCILLLLAVVFTGNCVRMEEQQMKDPKETAPFHLEITHFLKAMFCKKLVVDQLGNCILLIESNEIQPDVPEIGYYTLKISVAEAQELRQMTQQLLVEQMPPTKPMMSGAPVASILLEENNKVLTKSFDPYIPSANWQEINRRLPLLEQAALKSVKAGLHAELSFSAGSTVRSGPTGITVKLTGVGSHTISFYNPLAPPDSPGGRMRLMAVRTDIPEEKLTILHHKSYDLSAEMLTAQTPEDANLQKPLLQMEPEDALVLTFETILDWPPGQYAVRLNLMSNGPPPGDDETVFMRGQILTGEVQLTITGQSRPEDEGATRYEPPKL